MRFNAFHFGCMLRKFWESFEHMELRRYSDSPGGNERERGRICKRGETGLHLLFDTQEVSDDALTSLSH